MKLKFVENHWKCVKLEFRMLQKHGCHFKTLTLAWGKPTSTATRSNLDEPTSNTTPLKTMKINWKYV